MRIWRNLAFALYSAWQSLIRHAGVSLASVLTVSLILMIVGVNLIVGNTLTNIVAAYKAKVSVLDLSVANQTPLETIYAYGDYLRGVAYVSQIQFYSKDRVLQMFASNPANRMIVSELNGNPLAGELQIRIQGINHLAQINSLVSSWRNADQSQPTDYQGGLISRMEHVTSWLKVIGSGILLLLVVVSVVIVMNTIRTAVFIRQKEIEVMKLVGATTWFVRWPFLMEGMLMGVFSAVVATLVLSVGYPPFVAHFHSQLFFVPLVYQPAFMDQLAL